MAKIKQKDDSKVCPFCKGQLVDRRISYDEWQDGKLYVIKDVPVEECQRCGEQLISASVAKKIDKIIILHKKPKAYLNVPVFTLGQAASM